MRSVALSVVLLAFTACASAPKVARSRGQVEPWVPGQVVGSASLWSDEACYALMVERDNWTFAGAVLSGVGGAGGITAVSLPEGQEPNEWPRWTVGTVAAVSGAIGAAAVLVAKSKGETFEQYCTAEAGK